MSAKTPANIQKAEQSRAMPEERRDQNNSGRAKRSDRSEKQSRNGSKLFSLLE